jgi:hypothetical protein
VENDEIRVKEQIGPKTYDYENAEKFIKKHLSDKNTLLGPFIKDERWYVLKKRLFATVAEALNLIVSSNKFLKSLPKESEGSFKSFKLLKGDDLIRYATTEDKKKALSVFLSGREWWLNNLV